MGSDPDEDSGFWMVKPDTDDAGDPHLSVIHLDLFIEPFISCQHIKTVHWSTAP